MFAADDNNDNGFLLLISRLPESCLLIRTFFVTSAAQELIKTDLFRALLGMTGYGKDYVVDDTSGSGFDVRRVLH